MLSVFYKHEINLSLFSLKTISMMLAPLLQPFPRELPWPTGPDRTVSESGERSVHRTCSLSRWPQVPSRTAGKGTVPPTGKPALLLPLAGHMLLSSAAITTQLPSHAKRADGKKKTSTAVWCSNPLGHNTNQRSQAQKQMPRDTSDLYLKPSLRQDITYHMKKCTLP